MFNIGDKIGKRTIIEEPFRQAVPAGKQGTKLFSFCKVKCDCGKEDVVRCGSLASHAECWECGRKTSAKNVTTHGVSGSPLYSVWNSMYRRCVDKSDPAYKNYGGRGISVCPEWQDVAIFAEWARANGYDESLQIDRKDNDAGYSPENCRFVTCKVNQQNKRNNVVLIAFGESKPLSAWLEDPRCIVREGTLRGRIRRGVGAEKAITDHAGPTGRKRIAV